MHQTRIFPAPSGAPRDTLPFVANDPPFIVNSVRYCRNGREYETMVDDPQGLKLMKLMIKVMHERSAMKKQPNELPRYSANHLIIA